MKSIACGRMVTKVWKYIVFKQAIPRVDPLLTYWCWFHFCQAWNPSKIKWILLLLVCFGRCMWGRGHARGRPCVWRLNCTFGVGMSSTFCRPQRERNCIDLYEWSLAHHHTSVVHPQPRLFLLYFVPLSSFLPCLPSPRTKDALQSPSRCFVFVCLNFLLLDGDVTPLFHLHWRPGLGWLVF